jgi:tetratricopeptide (TPR) repeat protein
VAPEPAPAPELAPGQAEPVVLDKSQDYKAEQLRLAMRGIRYEGGVLSIDADVARTLVAGLDAEASKAAIAEGWRLIQANRRDEAIAAMTRAVLLAPDRPEAYEGLGEALTVRRKDPEAAAAFRAGVALAPDSANLHYKLGDSLSRAGEREDAIAEFRRALELDPDHAGARERLAVQLYYTGDTAGAWVQVHEAEARGRTVPPQFRALLSKNHPEPLVK